MKTTAKTETRKISRENTGMQGDIQHAVWPFRNRGQPPDNRSNINKYLIQQQIPKPMQTLLNSTGKSAVLKSTGGKSRSLRILLLFLTLMQFSGLVLTGQTNQNPVQSVCIGNEPYLVTATSGSTYNWSVTPGNPGTEWQINGTGNSITVDWNSAGVYTLSVVERNSEGCLGTPVTVTVTVNPGAAPTITASADPVCFGDIGTIYTTEPGMTGYAWTVNGGLITTGGTSTDNTVTVTWNGTGPYSVSVLYNNAAGCTSGTPAVLNVTVNPLPVTSPIFHN
jgi:hypothetical protein